jgi:hypothetical protein
MRKGLKRTLGLGLLVGAAFAIWRVLQARRPRLDTGVQWETAPFPFPPVPRPPAPEAATVERSTPEPASELAVASWVECNGSGECPATHPVKGKLSSGIYHVPGGQNYERTNADRCYVDTAAAEADGLRAAKR